MLREIRQLARVRLHRLAKAPGVRVLRSDGDVTEVAVDGLVCGVCAMRTHAALSGLAGVRAVSVDLDRGSATIRHDPGLAPVQADMARALSSIVVAKRVRHWMERAAIVVRALTRGVATALRTLVRDAGQRKGSR